MKKVVILTAAAICLGAFLPGLHKRAVSANVGNLPPTSRTVKVRVGYIGDSLLQGNNKATADGSLISTSTSREITWARALYPNFDVDTWIDLADPRHFTGMNAGVSGDTS